MTTRVNAHGLSDVEFPFDPADWRDLPDSGLEHDPDGDDVDGPTPEHVVGTLGFDPDEEGWA